MSAYKYNVKVQYEELMQEYNLIAVRYMLGDKSLEAEYNEIIRKIEAVEDAIYSKIELPEDYEPEETDTEADYEYEKMREEAHGI